MVTVFGIVTEVNTVQFRNELTPILVTEQTTEFIVTLDKIVVSVDKSALIAEDTYAVLSAFLVYVIPF
jgi:hypothetical protein